MLQNFNPIINFVNDYFYFRISLNSFSVSARANDDCYFIWQQKMLIRYTFNFSKNINPIIVFMRTFLELIKKELLLRKIKVDFIIILYF